MEIEGYKYTVEQDAIDARKLCADYWKCTWIGCNFLKNSSIAPK